MKSKATGASGRLRAFNRDTALRIALKLFCRHGFEGIAIADLTKAMQISPPSFYAAFGNKEILYREALALYQDHTSLGSIGSVGPVREQVRALLYDVVHAATNPEFPAGCMLATGMVNSSAKHAALAKEVAWLRNTRRQKLAEQLQMAVIRGGLPEGTNIEANARYLMALMQGIAIQARDGVATSGLLAMVDVALARWPGTCESG